MELVRLALCALLMGFGSPSLAAPKPPAKPAPPPPPAKPGDWAGADPARGGTPAAGVKGAPAAVETNEDLAADPADLDGAQVTRLEVGGVIDAIWSADGKFAYLLQKDGVVRKLAVPTWVEERKLEIGSPCSSFALCKFGLAVAVTGTQEIWLLGEDKLEVRKQSKVPGLKSLCAAPPMQVVLAHVGDKLAVINPTLGRVAAEITPGPVEAAAKKERLGIGFGNMAIAADGRNVFSTGDERLHRFRLDGASLTYVESSNWGGTNVKDVCVSPDGRYVSMPAGAGNSGGGGDGGGYRTHVVRADKLNEIVTTLPAGAYPQAVGFDPKAAQFYTQNSDAPLIVFSAKGQKLKEYHLAKGKPKGKKKKAKGDVPGLDVRKYLVHPGGKRLLVLGGAAYWVELP